MSLIAGGVVVVPLVPSESSIAFKELLLDWSIGSGATVVVGFSSVEEDGAGGSVVVDAGPSVAVTSSVSFCNLWVSDSGGNVDDDVSVSSDVSALAEEGTTDATLVGRLKSSSFAPAKSANI